MDKVTISSVLLRIEAGCDIRADVKTWTPEGDTEPLHGAWLRFGDVTFALPHNPADRLKVAHALAAAAGVIGSDCYAQAPELGAEEAVPA